MKEENHKLKKILNLLKEERGFDFAGYRTSMLERRVHKRVLATNTRNIDNYLAFLNHQPEELDNLIDVLTINVSNFFRNPMTFEFLSKILLPELILSQKKDENLRVWSAGCSFGEEPYSVAILINEFLRKEEADFELNIFATDIDKKALKKAIDGAYNLSAIEEVKHGILEKYFINEGDQFKINSEIKKMVKFSFHDLTDKNYMAPQDSIFGGFDIILCRNVLIYFDPDYQQIIFNKLYKSLNTNGILILGEAEVPINVFKNKFRRENKYCKIYRKIG